MDAFWKSERRFLLPFFIAVFCHIKKKNDRQKA